MTKFEEEFNTNQLDNYRFKTPSNYSSNKKSNYHLDQKEKIKLELFDHDEDDSFSELSTFVKTPLSPSKAGK